MTEASSDEKPQPPTAPEPWECCQSGCDPCVYDLYWQALERYETMLRAWEARQKPQPDAD
jgi:hypothetical protein